MICEFQNQHELDYAAKTAAVLKQVADRRTTMHEKNASTALDNTADDIQEARDDNGCVQDVTMLKKRTTTRTRSMGRVAQLQACSENGDRSAASTSQQIKSARKSVREDLELRWVTNLSEERKRFYLITTLLDPRTKLLSFCDNKYFP